MPFEKYENASQATRWPVSKAMKQLVVVGTVAIDQVKTPFGERDRVFGGSASYFSYAASFFTPVALVAVVGRDFPPDYRKVLEEKAIDLSHLEVSDGKTFFWRGEYGNDLNTAHTLETQLNVLMDFNPRLKFETLPDFLFLANMDPALQLSVLDQVKGAKLKYVACDTMNFWIENKREDLLRVLKRVHCVVLNDGEARQLTGESNLIRAAAKMREMGPNHIVIKKGEHGALVFFEGHFFALPAYPLESVFDPTGAGDSFAGGLMGCLAAAGEVSLETMKSAVAMGSIVASFTVEDFGLERLRRLARAELDERLEIFRRVCSF
ncbi:MAG: PfkB family carbohydrate kinase [Candidatus Omnitrophota bacterium]|nr:PfkB family carbohydrate kinase [Candidatus Omnitrophota bacterium]